MPDDLRTRIAAVQRAHRLVTRMVGRKAEKSCLCGWRSPERDCTFTDHPEHVADAVIRELDPAIPCAASGCRMRQITRQHADKTCGLTDSTDAK